MKDDMAQVLNCGNNHWVAMSTNLHGEPPTAQLIADLLQTKEDEITVSMDVQQIVDFSTEILASFLPSVNTCT